MGGILLFLLLHFIKAASTNSRESRKINYANYKTSKILGQEYENILTQALRNLILHLSICYVH